VGIEAGGRQVEDPDRRAFLLRADAVLLGNGAAQAFRSARMTEDDEQSARRA
jgi:hypothetical protein